MPRTFRAVAVGYPHHVTQRGNNREQVFFDDQDRQTYLDYLNKYATKEDGSGLQDCKLVGLAWKAVTHTVHVTSYISYVI